MNLFYYNQCNQDRNILLIADDLGNLSQFNKDTISCPDGSGVFGQSMYGKFSYTKSSPSSISKNYGVFEINNLPPHFRREVRIEVFVIKVSQVGVLFKLDNMTPISYQFQSTNTGERFNLPCDNNNVSDKVLNSSDYYYDFTTYVINKVNYFTITMPPNNAYTMFSVVDNGANSGSSYLRVKEIQYNIELCDNSCLACSGSAMQCTQCDVACSSLSGSRCIINQPNQHLQEGKCVSICTAPHFLINGSCVWIPNCQSVSSGSTQCTTCITGFVRVQMTQYEFQCQQYCPADYQLINDVCIDIKDNAVGQYLQQGLYQTIFSFGDISKLSLSLTDFQTGNTDSYNSRYTRCGFYFLLGGYFSFKQSSKITTQAFTTSYDLVRISFKWILIDYKSNNNPTGLTFQVVGSSSPIQTLNINGINPQQICGLSVPEYVGDFQYEFQVPNGQVQFQISNQMQNINSKDNSDNTSDHTNKNQYFGIRELSIFAYNCLQTSCKQCQVSTQNICTQCKDGFYLSGQTCQPCSSLCSTCTSAAICQVCKGGAVLNSQEQCVCPQQQYFQGSNCVPCLNTQCKTCDTTDSTKCLTCLSGDYFINNDCVLNCPIKTFPNSQTQTCDSCIPDCSQCSNNSTCDICISNSYLSVDKKNCLSNCPIGQQQNSNLGQCIKCTDPNCYSCQTDVNQCTQCLNTYNLQGFECKKNCDPTYFPVNQVCQLCSTIYTDCSLCTNSACTACQNNFFIYNGICYNPCPLGYYDDQTTNPPQCTKCQLICQQCTSSNICQSCKGLAVLNTSNQCVCPDKYYWDGSDCLSCSNPLCQTCDPKNSFDCLTCPTGKFLHNNTCVNSCPNKTFQDSANQKCGDCLNNCEICNDNSICQQCITNFYLSEDKKSCLNTCPIGYYSNSNTWSCIKCTDINCNLCQSDPSQCTQCGNNFNLQGQICQTNCNSQYYPVNNVCILCSTNIANCEQCTSSGCILCENNNYLYNGKCVAQCPSSYYVDINPPSCQACLNQQCDTCESAPSQNCLSCVSPYYLKSNQCVTDCGPTMYSSAQRVCTLCSSSFSGCLSCTANQCNSCINSADYLNPIINTCGATCPSNTFKTTIGSPSQKICSLCDSNCLTCYQSNNNCTSCQSNMYLQGTSCQSQCNIGFYPNPIDVCISCTNNFPNCSQCTSSQCQQCQNPYYFVQGLNNCQQNCPSGYATSSINGFNECIQCINSLCKECFDSNLNSCKSCYGSSSNPLLQGDNCVSSCSSNYYQNSTNQCILCSSTFAGCATCSQSACFSCSDPTQYLDITTNSCVNTCIFPLVPLNSPIKQCVQNCSSISSCIKCSTDINNNQICQLCNNGLVIDQNQCVANCPTGKYLDTNNSCQSCNQLFQNCSQCTTTTCSLCQNQNQFFDPVAKICTSQCIYGSNPNLPSIQCESCINLKCKACDSNNRNQCISCDQNSKYPYLQNGDCVDQCQPQFFQNGYQCNLCSKKFSNCNMCTINNCIKCDSNYYLSIDQQVCSLNCPSKQYQANIGGINICQNCQNQRCQTCDPTNSTSCLSCDQNSNLRYLENYECLPSCSPANYADQNNICQICNQKFFNCINCTISQCQSCKNGLYLDDQANTCSNQCSSFKYKDDKTSSCQFCNQKTQCEQCDPQSPNTCFKCTKSYFMTNNQCVSSCPEGTFADSYSICQPCNSIDPNCIRCNIGICTQCKQSEFYLNQYKNECVAQCPKELIKYTNKNGIQICEVMNSGGAMPYLNISEDVSRVDDKIIFQAQITFDIDVFVINQNWIFNLDNEYPPTDYEISYDLSKIKKINQSEKSVYTLKILINIIVSVSSKRYSQLNVNFINQNNIIDNQNFGLKITQLSGNLPSYNELVYPKINNITKIPQAFSVFTYIMLLIGSPFYFLVSLFDILQLTNYLLYLNVQYQSTLYNALKLLDFANFEIIPNIKNDHSSAPFKFRMENVDTFFFSNIIQSIAIWTFSLILYIICKFLTQKFSQSSKMVIVFCRSYKQQYFYQIIVGMGFLTYCDLLLAIFLQFYDSSQTTLYKGLGVSFGMFVLLFIIYLNYLAFNSTKIETNDLVFNSEMKKLYGFLYRGLEVNRKKAIVNLLLLFRRTIVIQQLVFNQDNQINQTYLCCLAVGVETTVILILRPYQSQREFKLHILSRFILISAIILIIILAINDTVSNLSEISSLTIQIIVSIQVIIIYMTQVSYLVYKFYRMYKQKYF